MKTTLDLPEKLVAEARKYSPVKTKRGVVIHALEALVRRRKVDDIFEKAGTGAYRFDRIDLDRARHGR
jgi:Arc/MetJ family transcription regulator